MLESVALYRSAGCDGVIGLGGGSAIDVAKAVVVMARHEGALADLEAQAGGMDRMTGPYDPIIAIPTTAGTGSEVGRSSVITSHQLGRKIIIFSPWLMPKRAILDPELTVSLPPFLTAATGMDAFTHCLESLTCPTYHPLCDAIAIHGLELVIRYLERATRDGKDIEARGNMQVAAAMGAIAFQKDLGATHSLAHPLSTAFGLHHGLANALCLPAVMRFNLETADASLRASRPPVRWSGPPLQTDRKPPAKSIDEVEGMIGRLGITPRSAQPRNPAREPGGPVRQRLRRLLPQDQHPSVHAARSSGTVRRELEGMTETSLINLVNPATEEIFRAIEPTSDAELASVLEKMRAAQGKWREVPVDERVEICREFVEAFRSIKESVALDITRQMGKPLMQATP